MCSISGFISKKPIAGYMIERLAASLLYHGAERGEQSAGVYVNGKLFKKAMSPDEFIFLPEFEELFLEPSSAGLFHTRWPTCGGLGDEQAQPFIHGETITVHNGWFSNMGHLKRTWNLKKASGVDSELVAEFIHNYGIRKLPKFFKSTQGSSAFGILYHGSLYLLRHGNPTAYTFIDLADGNTIFIFASTLSILKRAVGYCWLIPSSHPFAETKEGYLFKVTPNSLEKQSDRIQPKSQWELHGRVYHRENVENWYPPQTEAVDYPDMPYFQPSSDSESIITQMD